MHAFYLPIAFLFFAFTAHAEKPDLFADESVKQFQQMALEGIARGMCGETMCDPATTDEMGTPPVTLEETRQVMKRGLISAMAAQCQMDWENQNFLPMMQYWRHTLNKNPRQMALIGITHGIILGMAERKTAGQACPESRRQQVAKQLPFIP